ncbi:MAG: M48 family metallopeptidase [Oscillospiraceae bacterium]|nr:M48 family metallopeptidase [Oscillospiraceae bacterium]
MNCPEQTRTVRTDSGPLTYVLTRKPIRNWNLHVRDEQVLLSAPMRVSNLQADLFIQGRADWILSVMARQRQTAHHSLAPMPRTECLQILSAALDRVLPLVTALGIARPQLRLRKMRSQWGNCHYQQGYITLNVALAGCPEELQDYVVLHELVHFLHHDHGQQFKATMTQLMPDWWIRRRELKAYVPT